MHCGGVWRGDIVNEALCQSVLNLCSRVNYKQPRVISELTCTYWSELLHCKSLDTYFYFFFYINQIKFIFKIYMQKYQKNKNTHRGNIYNNKYNFN